MYLHINGRRDWVGVAGHQGRHGAPSAVDTGVSSGLLSLLHLQGGEEEEEVIREE